jgi:hypothetical protein
LKFSIRKLKKANIPLSNAFLSKEYLILKSTHETAEALLTAFDMLRKLRGGKGPPTEKEQDILRAMLVLVSGGFDSMLKNLIIRSIPHLAKTNSEIKYIVEKFIEKRLKSDDELEDSKVSNKFLARVLFADSQQSQVINEFIKDLTSSSLQSQEEVFRAVNGLGLDPAKLNLKPLRLKEIFNIRNKIIHEFDIIFDVPGRNRVSRNRNDMIKCTNEILELSEMILVEVGKNLTTFPSGIS